MTDAEQKNNAAAGGKKLLMIVGDYVEDYEAMVPFQTLTSAGYTVDVICPDKKAGDTVKTSIHDFEGAQTYSEKRGHNFNVTCDFKKAAADLGVYKGLVIPGGRAPEYLSVKPEVLAVVQHFADKDLPIASICHGILLLTALSKDKSPFLSKRTVTCYPACSPSVVAVQGNYMAPEPITMAVTNGNLVTAAAWPGHPQWMEQFLKVLGAKVASPDSKKKLRVLMLAGDYVEDYEMMCPFQMLTAFGVQVDTICPDKAADGNVKTCVHDFEGDQTYSEKVGHNFGLNADFAQVSQNLDVYDGLYIPGGRAPEYLSVKKEVLAVVEHFIANEKAIASICHGQLILAACKNGLTNKSCTAYPAC